MYSYWQGTGFPGGNPPPLSPDEEVMEELCNFIRKSIIENCKTGVELNPDVCDALLCTSDSPDMTERKRRHKHGEFIDDEDNENALSSEIMMGDDTGNELSDLSFDEVENSASAVSKYKVEIDSVASPNAVVFKSGSSDVYRLTVKLTVTAFALLSYLITK